MPVLGAVISDYHLWLLEMMRIDLPEHSHYYKLMDDLDKKEFTWINDMDENRDMDAFELRKEYYFDNGYDVRDVFTGPRSVLEVLVALSRRIEIEITGEPGNDHIEKWFWEMLKNLGVLIDDDIYDHEFVDRKLDIWLERRFNFDGRDGIFPLKTASFDQRKTDIWYQMQNYLMENYEF